MRHWLVACTLFAACIPSTTRLLASDPYEKDRKRLVDEIIRPEGVTNERVLHSVLTTQRHEFIPTALRAQAYYDRSLPIGHEQTISSPFIVAFMTEQLDPQPTDKVLEIGTGSGYQAAILSPLVSEVYTIEIVPELGHHAEKTLKRLGYKNVHAKVGDGYLGWPDVAPFDKIIVTCSPEKVPQPLIDQLKEGGRIIIPVGERYQQVLYLMEKQKGELKQLLMRPTLFVPMTGQAEAKREKFPDGSKPQVVNGDFEAPVVVPEEAVESSKQNYVPGWYYGHGVELVEDTDVPGNTYARFSNTRPALPSHLLQGIAVDGKKVHELTFSTKVRATDIRQGLSADEVPMLTVTFYDATHKEVAIRWLGPFRNASAWTRVEEAFKVPPQTHEMIIRIGLFGATGTVEFDDIEVKQ